MIQEEQRYRKAEGEEKEEVVVVKAGNEYIHVRDPEYSKHITLIPRRNFEKQYVLVR